MDNKKIGKFIAALRKEKDITQEQLAFEIMTTRENVSKWERGVNTPTPESLLLLSKYFDVTVNEILMGERKTDENKEQIDNMSVEVMKAGEKKVKKVLKSFITIVSLMVVAFFVYYFFNTYNTIRVYKIDGDGNIFHVREGLAIFSKGKSYLRVGELETDTDLNYDNFEIFYKDKDEEKLVLASDDTNYTLLSSYGYDENFSFNNLNKIVNNTYIRIKYQGKEEIIKLKFKRDMVNNFLVPNSENDIGNYNGFERNIDNVIQRLNDYAKKKWQYNSDTNEYSYSSYDKNLKYDISYQVSSDRLIITEYKNNNKDVTIEIFLYSYVLKYSENTNSGFKEIYSYDFNKNKCLTGKCDDNITNHYLENYLNKFIK